MNTATKNFCIATSIFVFLAIASLSPNLSGQVIGTGPNGFEIKVSQSSARPSSELETTFVNNVGKWWSKDHTWSGDSANLSIDLDRCVFVEKLANGGFCRHLTLEHYEPGKLIRFTGALGPLKEMGLNGTMTIRFSDKHGKGLVDARYVLQGFSRDGFEGLAPVVHKVLDQQFERLVNFVETGSPENIGAKKTEDRK